MSENKRVVYIVWKLEEENYGGTDWYPVFVSEDQYDAENYAANCENDYDVTVMYTAASVEAPLNEEA